MKRQDLPRWREEQRIHVVCLLLLVAMLSAPMVLHGQALTGRIVGIVSDTTGAVVPKANVTATSQDTGLSFKAISNEQGYYVVPALPAGKYALTVELTGFKKLERRGITLDVNQTARVDLQLQVGAITERVTVEERAPLINSENVDLGTRYYRNQITDLPLMAGAGRSILDFVHYGAGTTEAQGKGSNSVAMNGSRNVPPVTMLDGTNIAVGDTANTYIVRPQVENVQEIKIDRGTYSAESGGMGATHMITLSGTNEYHGSAYYFLANQELMARNFFAANAPGPSKIVDWGGTVTAPIIKNRTFAAFTLDNVKSKSPAIGFFTVPTAAMRSGNFQGIGNIFDPGTTRPNPDGAGVIRTQFPNNQIPRDRMDPVSVNLMAYFPETNLPGLVNNLTNEPFAGFYQPRSWTRSIKVDHKISDQNHLFVRYQRTFNDNDGFVFYPNAANPTYTTSIGTGHVGTVGDTHTFGPRSVNEFRIGFVRYGACFCSRGEKNGDWAQKAGLKNASGRYFPIVKVSGLIGTGLGLQYGDETELRQENTQFSDTFTYIRGSHTMKFGSSLKKDRFNNLPQGHPQGMYSFTGIFTNQPTVAGGAIGFADYLLGLASTVDVNGPRAAAFRKPLWSLFAEDDFKLRPNLTLNLGLRFEADMGTSEVYNRMSNFSPTAINPATNTPGALVFAGRDAPRRFVDSTYTFSPRVGLAYSLNQKTVFRVGSTISNWPNPIYNQRNNENLGFLQSIVRTTTDQVTPALRLQDGAPLLPPLRQTGDIGNGGNTSWVPRNVVAPKLYQWSFSIQRQVPGSLLVEAAYVGSRGIDNWFSRNINQVPPALRGPGAAQSRRPFPQFLAVNFKNTDGSSKYHSFQLTATKRLSHGLSFGANYTISKALDNSSWTSSGGAGGGSAPFQELGNLRAEWSVTESDIPQVFNLYGTYEIPQWAPGRIGKYVAKGWQLGYIARANSGLPVNLGTSVDQTGALAGTVRPDRLRDGRLPTSQRSIDRWFDGSAFALPALWRFGTAARNVLRAPGFANLDASVFKNTYFKTKLNEATNIQFRAEASGVLNHPTFGAPNATIGSLAAGTIRGAGGARSITIGLRFVF